MAAKKSLKFRVATPEDAPQVKSLVESAFRAEDSRPNWIEKAFGSSFYISVEEVTATITKPDGAMLMAFDENNLFVGSVEVAKRNPELARISMLSVDPTQQCAGYGRQILAHAETFCQQTWGVGRIGLNALSTREELVSWYMRCGYRQTGETTPFPVERFPDLRLPNGLCFTELEKNLKSATI